MAPHTSPAALHRLWVAVALTLLLGCAGAPAGATEQVFIWRDASGDLRFDAVQTADARRQPSALSSPPVARDREHAPIVLTGTTQPER